MGGPLESAVLTELYLLRRRSLLARLAGRVGHWHTAEDLAQDAWVQLTRAVATQPVNRPEAFLNETARNIATDHARRARRRARVETEYFDPAALEDVADRRPFRRSLSYGTRADNSAADGPCRAARTRAGSLAAFLCRRLELCPDRGGSRRVAQYSLQ